MVSTRSIAIVMLLGMMFGVPPVISAHHSVSAEYDTNQEVALKGVVSKIEYTNPHTALFIDVTDNDGTVTTWELELLPPAMLFRNGWTPTSVPVGVTLTVKCYLAKDGVHRAHANEAVMADGRKLRLGMNDPK